MNVDGRVFVVAFFFFHDGHNVGVGATTLPTLPSAYYSARSVALLGIV